MQIFLGCDLWSLRCSQIFIKIKIRCENMYITKRKKTLKSLIHYGINCVVCGWTWLGKIFKKKMIKTTTADLCKMTKLSLKLACHVIWIVAENKFPVPIKVIRFRPWSITVKFREICLKFRSKTAPFSLFSVTSNQLTHTLWTLGATGDHRAAVKLNSDFFLSIFSNIF